MTTTATEKIPEKKSGKKLVSGLAGLVRGSYDRFFAFRLLVSSAGFTKSFCHENDDCDVMVYELEHGDWRFRRGFPWKVLCEQDDPVEFVRHCLEKMCDDFCERLGLDRDRMWSLFV